MQKNLKKYQEVITDENSSGSVLFLLVYNVLSQDMIKNKQDPLEMVNWDPDTFHDEIKEAFRIEMPESNFNKMMAARELVASNTFWQSLPDFIMLCNALDSGTFDTRVFDAATMDEISWAVVEATLMWPPEQSSREEFADEIVAYIREVAAAEGLSKIPAVLKFAIPEDNPIWDQITAQFADDPQMFEAVYQLSQTKTATIDNMLLERLDYMIRQLKEVELAAETSELVQNVRDLIAKYAVKEE
ncbi:MAG: hypothetical protein WDA42_09850 [Candidatus Bathyarchaeia archaeon]|jgi:hypothetical protein